jgi:hypothetical protein
MYNARKMHKPRDKWRSREYAFVDYTTQVPGLGAWQGGCAGLWGCAGTWPGLALRVSPHMRRAWCGNQPAPGVAVRPLSAPHPTLPSALPRQEEAARAIAMLDGVTWPSLAKDHNGIIVQYAKTTE